MPASRANDDHFVTRWTVQSTCFEVAEVRAPYGFTTVADGDSEGVGQWTFEQRGPAVDITFDWRIRAEKPLLRWAMAQGKPA